MKNLLYSLAPIIGLQLLVLVAALFVHVHSPGRGVVKLLLVPLALSCVLASPVLFTQLMGYAVSWPLPDKFTFVAYSPVVEGGRKVGLEIWLRERGATRLHLAPYSKELEQILKDAAAGAKGGRQARITKRGKGEPGQDESKSPRGPYELQFQSPSDVPKDTPPHSTPPAREEPITGEVHDLTDVAADRPCGSLRPLAFGLAAFRFLQSVRRPARRRTCADKFVVRAVVHSGAANHSATVRL